jgi:hypothetical protein
MIDVDKVLLDIRYDLESSIETRLKAHMKQQPHRITCTGCGNGLDADTEVDDDGDLILEVTPCPECTNKGESE